MLDIHVGSQPHSLNVDFEKAVFNATREVWDKCNIYGCFFYLSQSFLRKIQSKYITIYKSDAKFRESYRLMQALAYLPEKDVIDGL